MIYCFGDSITDGRPGITYIKYLAGKDSCVNCGVGGDTVIGVTKRLMQKLSHPLDKNDYIILGIGTNDILLPYFSACSASWRRIAKMHIAGGSVHAKDLDAFQAKYRELLSYCRGITGNILVFGLPLLESPQDMLDDTCEKYNREIEALCRDGKIRYIDFRKWQIEQKKLLHNEGSFFMTANGRPHMAVTLDVIITTYLPFASKISKRRGLAVTVDGCHLNELYARGLAGLIDRNLEDQHAVYSA